MVKCVPGTGDQLRVRALYKRAVRARERLKRVHPAWFRDHIEYPVEDFSSPDLSGIEVDLSGLLE